MTVAVPTITDVVFICGVLLDWRTRTCLEGIDDATVDRICAYYDPAGFFGDQDEWTPGRTSIWIWPGCGV